MNELQAMQLEMLRTFWQICSQLHLHPYLICGSALGAVKYQGFIPWDDDVDVALTRPEYERFLAQAPTLLPDSLFLQTVRTDPAFPQLYAKLRRNHTAFVEERAAHLSIHHGVSMDLFPLDGLPENPCAAWLIRQRVRLCKWKLLSAYGRGGSRTEQFIRRIGRTLGWHRRTAQAIDRTEKRMARCAPETASRWCCFGNWRVSWDCAPASQYGSGVEARFEEMDIRIPAQFDAYLTQRYGDWRADLPKDQRHGRKARIDLCSDRLWRKP